MSEEKEYGDQEPDQIEMMSEDEVKLALRQTVKDFFQMRDRAESLESRLKEAEKELEIEKIINQERFNEKQALLARLSQAEAENKTFLEQSLYGINHGLELQNRLSQVLKASEGLEKALETCAIALNLTQDDFNTSDDDGTEIMARAKEEAKQALKEARDARAL